MVSPIFFSEFLFDSSSSDDELDFLNLMRESILQRGSQAEKKTRKTINRDRVRAHERLMADYFNDDCLYNSEQFEQRYRMSRRLFIRIANGISERFEEFRLRYDARGRRGFTTYQKVTSALRQLAYGIAADANDEYLKMSARTSRECVYLFCEYLIQVFGKVYLRNPTRRDVETLYSQHLARHGLPGMLGSIDCTHVRWENCPTAWRGQFTRGDHEGPTMMLEAVASQDLWIWHSFCGMPGASNDINVLNASPILEDILEGKAPDMPFVVNGTEYKFGYYLGDGIYPPHASFVKAYSYPQDDRRKLFKTVQESARKDVERAFGVLKSK